MSAKVTLIVRYPSGGFVVGATVIAYNLSASDDGHRTWEASTWFDGKAHWNKMDTGVATPDMYKFQVMHVDENGVQWTGSYSDRIWNDSTFEMILKPVYEGVINLSDDVLKNIGETQGGEIVLTGLYELSKIVGTGSIQAVTLVAGWVMEGLIRLKARVEGLWKEEWEKRSLGEFIDQPAIQRIIPDGLRARIRGITNFRKLGAHYKDTIPLAAEAELSTKTVEELAVLLYGIA